MPGENCSGVVLYKGYENHAIFLPEDESSPKSLRRWFSIFSFWNSDLMCIGSCIGSGLILTFSSNHCLP